MKKLSILLMIILLIVPTVVFAGEPYEGYIYQEGIGFDKEYPSTCTFEPQKVITGESLGITNFKTPRDLVVFEDKLYLLDSGNGRIVILNQKNQLIKVLDHFVFENKDETLNDPNGLMMTKDYIYVADTENQRILQMDYEGKIEKIYTKPDSRFIKQDRPFSPQKVVVDSVGNVYTNVKGVFDGLVEYNKDGVFTGFFGGDRITNLFEIADLIFWKSILTEEQQSRMKRIIPIEYGNIAIDEKNFIYTVSQAAGSNGAIRKLNWKGKNLLGSMTGIAARGYGDLRLGEKPPSFIDVCMDENNLLYCLDTTTGRIFQYDQQGNMLSIFGRYGSQTGTFSSPIAIESFEEKIYVLDNQLQNITVFQKTEFGEIVSQAIERYTDGNYDVAAKIWEDVIEINPNFMLAYTGIGKKELLNGNYENALKSFERAANQKDYSEAFKMYRTQFFKDNFIVISIGTIILIGLAFLILAMIKRKKFVRIKEYIKKHERLEKIVLPCKIMFSPIDGFEELKFKNKGSMLVTCLLAILLFMAFSVEWLYTGFTFKSNSASTFKLIIVLMQTVGMLAIWSISNYAFCSLMDGKGKFKHIVIATSYALLPTILAIFINVGLSQVLVQEEQFVMQIINSISLVWTLVLIVNSLMVLHQYTLKKTIQTILLTLIGVVIILFLIALCFILYSQVMTFVKSVYNEILLRM